jgi:hypothetical protein
MYHKNSINYPIRVHLRPSVVLLIFVSTFQLIVEVHNISHFSPLIYKNSRLESRREQADPI